MAMEFFLGANSKDGFVSLYPQLQKEAPRRLYLVKSGPGCGKATCIRALSEALGGAEELFHCSSDPDSLDGAVVGGRAILDGTAPHVFEPDFPGCDGDYLTLPPFKEADALAEKAGALYALQAAAKAHYAGAYRLLAAAAKVREERRQTVLALVPGEGAVKRAAGLLRREVPKTGRPGQLRLRFLDGVTPKGLLCLHQTVTGYFERIIALKDSYGLGRELLEALRDGALERGQTVYACLDPLEPQRVRHLLLPDCKLAFVTDGGDLPYEPARALRLDALVPAEALRSVRGRLRLLGKLEGELLEDAVAHVTAAHALHDQMEALYRPHIRVEDMAEHYRTLLARME